MHNVLITKLSYLGPANTFSEKAAGIIAQNVGTNIDLIPKPSVEAVARSLKSDDERCDLAVLPYYNYLEGLVQECMDLIYEHRLCMIGAQRIEIEWALGKYPGSSKVDTVYSHSKALAQCSEYLWEHYPRNREITVSSTADGAAKVSLVKAGLAIAGRDALQANNLEILAENIGNKRHGRTNFTDFHLVAANDVNIPNTTEFSKKPNPPVRHDCDNVEKTDCLQPNRDPEKQYLTMIAVTPQVDRSGLLAEILNQVAYYNLNSAKIHSRPALDDISMDLDPQMFYLELMCHKSDPDFIQCIDAIRYRLTPKGRDVEVVRVLGSYPRPT